MKILLIYPWVTMRSNFRWYGVEPLGLLSIATYLKKVQPHHEIRILDAQLQGPPHAWLTHRGYRMGMTNEQLTEYVKGYAPDVIGISCCYTVTAQDALEVAQIAVAAFPKAMIVLGGAHATIDANNLSLLPYVDIVVRGEGEITFAELVAGLEKNQILRFDGTTYVGCPYPDREPIKDLDSLPIPDRSLLLDYSHYLNAQPPQYSFTLRRPVATIMTSRGCPYHCLFCSTQKVWQNNWRPRSPQHILSEIEYLMNTYGVREFAIQDDQFMGSKERVKELCWGIIERKWKISFIAPPGISPALIDYETLRLMRWAGFYRLCFSIDAGTAESVKQMRKPVNLKRVRQVVRWANQLGFWVYGTFVIGYPTDTRENILNAIQFAYSLRLDHIIWYIAQPHLGSELYDDFIRRGWLKPNVAIQHHTPAEVLFGTETLSPGDLDALRTQAIAGYMPYHLKRHFTNPGYLWNELLPKLRTPKRLLYAWRVFKHAIPILKTAGRW